jgi:hypothetical protein
MKNIKNVLLRLLVIIFTIIIAIPLTIVLVYISIFYWLLTGNSINAFYFFEIIDEMLDEMV